MLAKGKNLACEGLKKNVDSPDYIRHALIFLDTLLKMLNITFHTVTLAAARHVPCERHVFFRVASVEIKSYSLVASLFRLVILLLIIVCIHPY